MGLQIYFNRNGGLITTDPSLRVQATAPFAVTFDDNPVVLVTFHRDGALQVPAAPTIEIVVKKTGDFLGPSLILDNSFTTPGAGQYAFAFNPNFTSEALAKLLLAAADGNANTIMLGNDVANQAARYALTGKANGYVVYETDTATLWELIDSTNIGNSAGWTADVPLNASTTLTAVIVLRESPNFGKESSLPFLIQIIADYYDGSANNSGSTIPFGLAFLCNRYDITTLTGGAAGDLDFIPTAGQGLVGTLLAVNIDPGPLLWRLQASPVISSTSVATTTVVTTVGAHGLVSGQSVNITGDTSTPSLNGTHTVTVTGFNIFTVPVNVTVAGAGGTITPANDAQNVRPVDWDGAANPVYWKARL